MMDIPLLTCCVLLMAAVQYTVGSLGWSQGMFFMRTYAIQKSRDQHQLYSVESKLQIICLHNS